MGNACKSELAKLDFTDTFSLKIKDVSNIPNRPIVSNIKKPYIHGPKAADGFFVEMPILLPEVSRRLNQNTKSRKDQNCSGQYHGPFKSYTKSFIYMGDWQDHQPQGKGRGFYPDGSVFDGEFNKGLPFGFGKYILSNGDYYEGNVVDGLANGYGKYITENSVFQGMFVNNKQDGKGKETTKDFIFEGFFKQGDRLHGTLSWASCKYTGDFINDLYDGKGTFESPEGIYTGDFRKGLKEGFGVFQWPDGTIYKGEFKADAKDGQGVLISGDGNIIVEGRWQKDIYMPEVVKPFPQP